jgi:hypothetical protein
MYPFPLPVVWTLDRKAVSLSTASGMDVQGVSQSIACSVDVQVYVSLFTFVKCFLNAGMMDCPASGQLGTGMNKNVDDGTIPVPE